MSVCPATTYEPCESGVTCEVPNASGTLGGLPGCADCESALAYGRACCILWTTPLTTALEPSVATETVLPPAVIAGPPAEAVCPAIPKTGAPATPVG